MMRMLIAIEGKDGSGKTAVRKHLFARLAAAESPPLTLNQFAWFVPRHAKVITGARYLGRSYSPDEILQAYLNDKRVLTQRLVLPHLPERHVICDRYVASDLAYLTALWGVPLDRSYDLYRDAAIRMPDLTVFLEKPTELVVERLRSKPAERRSWWETPDTVERLAAAFDHLLSGSFPALGPVLRLDTTMPLGNVLQEFDRQLVPRPESEPQATQRP